MVPRLVLAALLATLSAQAGFANCIPPASTMFACTIRDSQKRVEFCQGAVGDDGLPTGYSYNFADGAAPSELYFTTDAPWLSTKYYQATDNNAAETLGMALTNGSHFYTFYVTGVFGTAIRAAQLHVFDSQKAFQSETGENEIIRFYCDPSTILIDWTFVGP